MRTSLLCVLTAASIAVCQNYYDLQMSVRNTFYGGIALTVGEGASSMNPGVNACIEPIKKINKYFGAGGHMDYTWLSASGLPDKIGGGVHLFDIAFVPKFYVTVSDEMNFSFETDPGLFGAYIYYSEGGYSGSILKLFFGLTSGVAYNLGAFSFIFKFKTIFSDYSYERVRLVNWIAISAGIAL